MTPEGRVKVVVKRIILAYKPHIYSHWIVTNGMGHPTLDCIGWVDGDAFAVETKAAGEKLTPRQVVTMHDMQAGGGTVFAIIGRDELVLAEFDAWLHERVMRTIAKKHLLNKRPVDVRR